MIDAHAHLDSPRFDADRDDVLARAWSAGLSGIVTSGADVESSRRAVALAETSPRIWAAAGIHPHRAAETGPEDLAALADLVRHPRVVAVGECGLDRGPHNDAPLDAQERLFRAQIRLAREAGLPVVIHNRDAFPELFRILTEEAGGTPLRGMMHCFSGGPQEAARCLALGLHLSFSGTLTFKNAADVRAAAAATPLDRILVETDCPWLAPTPHRGERNEPARVALTVARLAQALGASAEDLGRRTDRTTRALFGIAQQETPCPTMRP